MVIKKKKLLHLLYFPQLFILDFKNSYQKIGQSEGPIFYKWLKKAFFKLKKSPNKKSSRFNCANFFFQLSSKLIDIPIEIDIPKYNKSLNVNLICRITLRNSFVKKFVAKGEFVSSTLPCKTSAGFFAISLYLKT